ncbi:HEL080Wp [Eremothecium sinecaudum]|uniref:HEL080Wp n=1 Tax=Eremothecium sinecaudum TaxID=45286 RepID=A0A0X8HTL4_9SACH|nr:HEL080Wp [Eremothecium sinecaudum]AMD21200.1 HEL080Wp [Eremothecium sinecaudum]
MSYGDELDDGLEYEVGSIASDVEGSIDETDEHLSSKSNDNKRSQESDNEADKSLEHMSKRQKKLAKSAFHKKKMEKMEFEKEQKRSVPRKAPEEIQEYLTRLIREKNPNLSVLEEELYFKKTDFISTQSFDKERNLSSFESFVNGYSKSPKALIFAQSNIRVADIFRSLGGAKCCIKLFSKTKLHDDVANVEELLQSSKPGTKQSDSVKNKNKKDKQPESKKDIKYFISTPTRMAKIVENTEAFFQGKEKLDIIIDASYLDPKTNSIFTSEDGMTLVRVLKKFLSKKSSVKILLY